MNTRTVRDFPPSVTIPATLVAAGPPESAAKPIQEVATSATRYTERILLGEGGMGKVLLCRDDLIGRDVAMKVILPELEKVGGNMARFLREASVQGQLEHPNIVPVHDIGVSSDGGTFFTMKRIRGLTLEEILAGLATGDAATVERFTLRRLLTAFVSVCLAVDFAHSRGVIHRDLKPANVMLGDFGEVYVLDWGIAKLARDDEPESSSPISASDLDENAVAIGSPVPKTADGTIVGTLPYMAPEQLLGRTASVQSDVFALGAMIFEILTGKKLRDADTTYVRAAKGIHEARASVRAPERNVPPELDAIAVRATAAAAAARFPNARALSEEVERFLEGDRDIIRRRELAAAHVATAQTLLASSNDAVDEQAGSEVMRELGSALALDPENASARKLVVEALTSVPRHVPREVSDAIEQRARDTVIAGAKRWPLMFFSWVVFFPLFYWAGVRDYGAGLTALAFMALAALLGSVVARDGRTGWIEYSSIAASVVGMIAVGRIVGPFILAPTLLATMASALQLGPRRSTRLFALAGGVAGLVGLVVTEHVGLLPRMVEVTPQGLLIHVSSELRDAPITLVIFLANLSAMLGTAAIVHSLRIRLSRAEERLLVHSWQVRGLMPARVTART